MCLVDWLLSSLLNIETLGISDIDMQHKFFCTYACINAMKHIYEYSYTKSAVCFIATAQISDDVFFFKYNLYILFIGMSNYDKFIVIRTKIPK